MLQVYNKNLINVDGSNISLQLRKRRESARHMRWAARGIICANFVLDISVGKVKEEILTFVTFSRTGTRCLLTTPEGATRPQQVLKKHNICSYFDLLPIENLIG